jgi:hypothetical protein
MQYQFSVHANNFILFVVDGPPRPLFLTPTASVDSHNSPNHNHLDGTRRITPWISRPLHAHCCRISRSFSSNTPCKPCTCWPFLEYASSILSRRRGTRSFIALCMHQKSSRHTKNATNKGSSLTWPQTVRMGRMGLPSTSSCF